MIKAIIFDFDATISNRQANAYNVFDDYLRQHFKDLSDIEYEAVIQDMLTYDMTGAVNVKYRLPAFKAKYGNNLPEDFDDVYTKFFYDNMYKYCVLKPDTIDVLNKLKGKYKLAILSNGQSASQHNKIDQVNINEYFDYILVSGDIGINKPDKRIYEYVADKLDVKCDECIFVGDTYSTDILGAIRSNMVPVWMMSDYERPSKYYKGIRIQYLSDLLDVLKTI